MSGAPPSDPVAVPSAPLRPHLEAIARLVRALPGSRFPMITIGMNDGLAFDALHEIAGGSTTESKTSEGERVVCYRVEIGGVDFMAGYTGQKR